MISEIIGFLLMVLNGWAVIIYWRLQGIPFWISLGMLTTYWSFTLLLTYFGTGWLIDILTKWRISRESIDSLQKTIKRYKKKNPFNKRKKKIIECLLKKKAWIVYSLSFVPFVPELPTMTIAAARIMKLKHAIPILLAANAFRVSMLCIVVYYFLKV
jgi:hypothetical protein